jgi:hypothetical protein
MVGEWEVLPFHLRVWECKLGRQAVNDCVYFFSLLGNVRPVFS